MYSFLKPDAARNNGKAPGVFTLFGAPKKQLPKDFKDASALTLMPPPTRVPVKIKSGTPDDTGALNTQGGAKISQNKRGLGAFTLTSAPKQAKAMDTKPKIAEILVGPPKILPPSKAISTKLGGASLVMGVDIETADWESGSVPNGNTGQFGYYHLCKDSDLESRLVQLGWAIGMRGQEATVKEYIVKPQAFVVSAKAEGVHGISHQRAEKEGLLLKDVLSMFVEDLSALEKKGGRIVAHHMEFDCGIIDRELQRCGMEQERAIFRRCAAAGYCTMNPAIGGWLRTGFGRDAGPEIGRASCRERV